MSRINSIPARPSTQLHSFVPSLQLWKQKRGRERERECYATAQQLGAYQFPVPQKANIRQRLITGAKLFSIQVNVHLLQANETQEEYLLLWLATISK